MIYGANNPFVILGVTRFATDEEVRGRYLDLLKRFPPEQFPKEFQEIRKAYQSLEMYHHRFHTELELDTGETPETILQEIELQLQHPRASIRELKSLL